MGRYLIPPLPPAYIEESLASFVLHNLWWRHTTCHSDSAGAMSEEYIGPGCEIPGPGFDTHCFHWSEDTYIKVRKGTASSIFHSSGKTLQVSFLTVVTVYPIFIQIYGHWRILFCLRYSFVWAATAWIGCLATQDVIIFSPNDMSCILLVWLQQ